MLVYMKFLIFGVCMVQRTSVPVALRRSPLAPRAAVPVLGLLALLLGGCSNSRTANKDNFTQAIQTFEKDNPERTRVCVSVNTGMTESTVAYTPESRKDDFFARLDGLGKLGYLTVKDTTVPGFFGPTEAIKIDVTPKFIQTFGEPSSSMEPCVGTFKLDRIDDFTEPSEMMGVKVSQVEATVKQVVTAEWTKNARLTQLVGYKVPPAERKQRYVLVLKDSGWAVSSLR